ncbi:MAG: PDZ domain-containing protein, partial [Rhizobiales bacterium]|nr:PDZ domain-containing protein [Hyphomicrobiales bacterium]
EAPFVKLGRAVGRLDVLTDAGVFPCTAFLISERHILTNHHCVPGIVDIPEARATRIEAVRLVLGYTLDGVAEGAEGFTVSAVPVEANRRLDYSILEVFGDPSVRFGSLRLASVDPVPDNYPYWIIGHPLKGAQRISREQCKSAAPAVAGERLRHTCDTLPGNSGSPVIDPETKAVVALHHAGSARDAINFAVPLSLIASRSEIVAGLVAKSAAPPPAPGAPLASAPLSEAAQAWESIKSTDNPAFLDAFIKRFPDTVFADFARVRIAELAREKEPTAEPAPATAPEAPKAVADNPPASGPIETRTALVSPPATAPAFSPAADLPIATSAADLIARVRASVVKVEATFPKRADSVSSEDSRNVDDVLNSLPVDHPFRDFFKQFRQSGSGTGAATTDGAGKSQAIGSGVIVSADGYIATVASVAAGADSLTVTLDAGNALPATLIDTDPLTGLTLLKIAPAAPLTAATFAALTPAKGEPVIAIGAPYGLLGSVSDGVVERLADQPQGGTSVALLEIDMHVANGHAGAPLFNIRGEVVALVEGSSVTTEGPTGLAMPGSIAGPVLEELRVSGVSRSTAEIVTRVRASAAEQPFSTPSQFFGEWSPAAMASARRATVRITATARGTANDGTALADLSGAGVSLGDGRILTSSSLVAGAGAIDVMTSDGGRYRIEKVLGIDARTGLALLHLPSAGRNLHAIEFAGDAPRAGQAIFAFRPDAPGGERGMLSAASRNVGSGPYDLVQYDLDLGDTWGGAPVFDATGRLAAITIVKYQPEVATSGKTASLHFGAPAALASAVAGELAKAGTVSRGWLGVKIQNLSPEIATSLGRSDSKGALVTELTEGGPAVKAGLLAGDLILAVDGTGIADTRDLARRIAGHAPGSRVTLDIVRQGASARIVLTLGTFPTAAPQLAAAPANAAPEAPAAPPLEDTLPLGAVELAMLTAQRKVQYGVVTATDGVLVQSVTPGSQAAEKGLTVGNVIVEVGQESVRSPRMLASIAETAANAGRDKLLLLVWSKEGQRFVALPVSELLPAKTVNTSTARPSLWRAVTFGEGNLGRDPGTAADLIIGSLRDEGWQGEVGRILSAGAGELPDDVRRALQQELKSRGLYKGAIDGDIGPGTQRALRSLVP